MARPARPWQQRFMRFLAMGNPEDCWPWQGHVAGGYGQFRRQRVEGAHRVSYEFFVGPILAGYEVDHVKARGCSRTDCVNPGHLEAVPPAVNIARAVGPTCSRGHDRAEVGTYPNGKARTCAACGRLRSRNAYRRRRGLPEIV